MAKEGYKKCQSFVVHFEAERIRVYWQSTAIVEGSFGGLCGMVWVVEPVLVLKASQANQNMNISLGRCSDVLWSLWNIRVILRRALKHVILGWAWWWIKPVENVPTEWCVSLSVEHENFYWRRRENYEKCKFG